MLGGVAARGQQHWEGFQVLCKPPELMNIDRRLFGLLVVLWGLMWQGMGSFRLGLIAAVGGYFACRWLTKRDPHFFAVLRLSARFDVAWCDPGDPPDRYGAYVLDVRADSLRAASSPSSGVSS